MTAAYTGPQATEETVLDPIPIQEFSLKANQIPRLTLPENTIKRDVYNTERPAKLSTVRSSF